jgi:hypothetical protein
MRSHAILFLVVSWSLTACDSDPAALRASDFESTRSLENGGFEDGFATPAYWWTGGREYNRFDFGWNGVESWEGARAVSIHRSNASATDFAYWAQTIFAQDFLGEAATLTVQIKTDLEGPGAAILIRGDDSYQPLGNAEVAASTQGRVAITGTQDWREFSVTLNQVPSSMKSLTIYLLFPPETRGTVLFDGVRLTR